MVEFISDKGLDFDCEDNNHTYCPFCGNPNSHIRRVRENDCRLPDSKHGNISIEVACESNPETHKWLVGVVEHKGVTWILHAKLDGLNEGILWRGRGD